MLVQFLAWRKTIKQLAKEVTLLAAQKNDAAVRQEADQIIKQLSELQRSVSRFRRHFK